MFICKECMDKTEGRFSITPISRGRCEVCGKNADCYEQYLHHKNEVKTTKKEPLKNKGTEAIKFVDFIIDLYKQQVEILNKQDGVEASLNEEGVNELRRKGKEMLGDTKVYDDKEVKLAVEWLKEKMEEEIKLHDKICNHKCSVHDWDMFNLIDKAFPDLQNVTNK